MNHPLPTSHDTLWLHTTAPAGRLVELAGDIKVDVAVVGAGFSGLTTALHLRKAGVNVAVLEAAEIGAGASGYNAGFVVPNFARADPAQVIAELGQERGLRLLELIGRGGDRL